MKKFRYVGPSPLPIIVPALNVETGDDGVIEVDDTAAAGFADQDIWEPVPAAKSKKEND